MSIIAYADSIQEIDVIHSELFLDRLSGLGGIPRGVITEIFGDESVGKSSLCLQLVASAQRQGLRCLWADVEWSYTPGYAAALGVDNSKLGLIRERVAEKTLDTLEAAIDSGDWDLVILDSVGGLHSMKEAEKDAEGKTIGLQAGLMARFTRKIVPSISIHNVAFIAINHAFTDLMSGKLMTSGGKKLSYHKSFSVRLKPKFGGNALKVGDRRVGKTIVGQVWKNKLAATEGFELEGQIIFGQGFSASADLLADALDKGTVTKRGNTYFFDEEKLGIGLQNARKRIESDADLAERIKDVTYGNKRNSDGSEIQRTGSERT